MMKNYMIKMTRLIQLMKKKERIKIEKVLT